MRNSTGTTAPKGEGVTEAVVLVQELLLPREKG